MTKRIWVYPATEKSDVVTYGLDRPYAAAVAPELLEGAKKFAAEQEEEAIESNRSVGCNIAELV